MDAVANYDSEGHLERLHLSPSNSCNIEHSKATNVRTLKTREEMLAAILSVTKLDQLCGIEYEDA